MSNIESPVLNITFEMKVSLKTMILNFFLFSNISSPQKNPSYHAHTFSNQHEVQNFCTAEANNCLAIDFKGSRAAQLHLRHFFSCFQQIIHHKFLFFSPPTLPLHSFLFLPSRNPGVCCFHGPLILPSHKPPCSSVISRAAGTQVLISLCNPYSCCSGFSVESLEF